MQLKLHRDKIPTIHKGKELVGVYVKIQCPCPELNCECLKYPIILAEMSPSKADAIIKLWNSK